MLLFDAGNRRLKWRGADATGALPWPEPAAFAAALDAALPDHPAPDGIWLSCVAAPDRRQALIDYCRDRWRCEPHLVTARAVWRGAAELTNPYDPPEALGSDRWLALIGARVRRPEGALIVIDAGTAVTVDLLAAAGDFSGGVILPGWEALQGALGGRTGQLPVPDRAPPAQLTGLATDTDRALDQGAWCAFIGGIERAVAAQRERSPDAGILITGGLAEACREALTAPAELCENLVLDGLAAFAESSSGAS